MVIADLSGVFTPVRELLEPLPLRFLLSLTGELGQGQSSLKEFRAPDKPSSVTEDYIGDPRLLYKIISLKSCPLFR